MIEWDVECARRKFEGTYCKVNVFAVDVPPTSFWAAIKAIKDSGTIWGYRTGVSKTAEVLGRIAVEAHELVPPDGNYPMLEFDYVSLPSGYYEDLFDYRQVWKIERKHGQKHYNIGLNNNSHEIGRYYYGEYRGDEHVYRITADMSKPILKYRRLAEDHILFAPGLEMKKNYLKLWGVDVGFVKGNKVIVNSPKVIPTIQTFMGDEWQIQTI
jgi:hypothetical protein